MQRLVQVQNSVIVVAVLNLGGRLKVILEQESKALTLVHANEIVDGGSLTAALAVWTNNAASKTHLLTQRLKLCREIVTRHQRMTSIRSVNSREDLRTAGTFLETSQALDEDEFGDNDIPMLPAPPPSDTLPPAIVPVSRPPRWLFYLFYALAIAQIITLVVIAHWLTEYDWKAAIGVDDAVSMCGGIASELASTRTVAENVSEIGQRLLNMAKQYGVA